MAEAKKKTYKLDLFRQTLPAMHRRDSEFYARCTDEERKEIAPLILMRWMSLAQSSRDEDYYIQMINELVNIEFWALSKHPELQWKLLAAVGLGSMPQHHKWFMGSKRASTSKVDEVILSLYPMLSDQELELARSKLDKDSLKQLLRDLGWPDSEIKPVMDEFKKTAR